MRKLNKKIAVVAAGTAVAVAGAGVAFAYWTTTGSGTGSATTDTAATWTLTQTSTHSDLAPGVAAEDIVGSVSNTKSQTLYIGTITPSIKEGAGGTTWQAGCSAADYDLTPNDVNADTADGATGVKFGTIAFHNTGSSQNGCKGQALVLSFSSN